MKKSAAYYLLKKMEETGLLSQKTQQEGNRPPRQVYHLTPAGEAEFQRLLRENLSHHHRAYFADDIGMVFLGTLPVQEARDLLSQRRDALQRALQETQDFPAHVESLQLVFDHLVYHLRSELAWVDGVLARLDAGQPAET
jgi:DNA-binding PadR family transcriptional regulator